LGRFVNRLEKPSLNWTGGRGANIYVVQFLSARKWQGKSETRSRRCFDAFPVIGHLLADCGGFHSLPLPKRDR